MTDAPRRAGRWWWSEGRVGMWGRAVRDNRFDATRRAASAAASTAPVRMGRGFSRPRARLGGARSAWRRRSGRRATRTWAAETPVVEGRPTHSAVGNCRTRRRCTGRPAPCAALWGPRTHHRLAGRGDQTAAGGGAGRLPALALQPPAGRKAGCVAVVVQRSTSCCKALQSILTCDQSASGGLNG